MTPEEWNEADRQFVNKLLGESSDVAIIAAKKIVAMPMINEYLLADVAEPIAKAINAAVDAERKQSCRNVAALAEAHTSERDWSQHLRIQLALEVEKVNKLQEQLAAERENGTRLACELSTARTQQQPLVDALKPFAPLASEIPNNRKQLGVLTQEDFIRAAAALAKVKDAATPTTGEWTHEQVQRLVAMDKIRARCIADAHNSALAAEKAREEFDWGHVKREYLRLQKENGKLQQQLAAETRKYSDITHKWEQCVIEIQELREQLATERDKVQPLVDALKPFALAAEELTLFRSIEAKDTFVWKPTNNQRQTAGITAQDLLNAKDALAKAKVSR